MPPGPERRAQQSGLFPCGGVFPSRHQLPVFPVPGKVALPLPPRSSSARSPRTPGPPPSEREDGVLDVPDILHHRYPEVVALPAAGGEPEVDDREPGERKEHQDRDRVGEEAGGGTVGEDGGDTAGAKRKEALSGKGSVTLPLLSPPNRLRPLPHAPVRRPRPPQPSGYRPRWQR